jgi:hypothetical protein
MRTPRTTAGVTAALVLTGGYVHWCLYARHGYRAIPKIGTSFLLQVIASVAVASMLLLGPRVAARVTHLPQGAAATMLHLAALGLAAGTLLAFALTRTSAGLFNFREQGLQPAPQALIALVAEAAVVVLAGGGLVVDGLRSHGRHALVRHV